MDPDDGRYARRVVVDRWAPPGVVQQRTDVVSLAVPVALLAAVVALRDIAAFESVRSLLGVQALAPLSRGLWSSVGVVGFSAVGDVRHCEER